MTTTPRSPLRGPLATERTTRGDSSEALPSARAHPNLDLLYGGKRCAVERNEPAHMAGAGCAVMTGRPLPTL